MFALKFALLTFFTFQSAVATPTRLAVREDWKIALGWDGKVTTPAELDPSNAVVALTKRAIGGVYFCTDADFHGNCVYVSGFSSGQCVGVGSNFNDNVSSFGPDRFVTCTIYSDPGCSGRATGGVIFPGINNLADYNNNDSMSSFSCTG